MAPLTPGSKLGPYEILSSIGAGGMGSVYRARDSRLSRDVAIKVSSERFSERFEREARTVASLNHPNICTLHDVGPDYLVMELVEGETLLERIKQGPLPIDEALRIATQIAEALGAAHDKGIVHRDLKPGNVMLKPDGSVKVLDFGLAKFHNEPAPDASGVQTLNSPTFSMIHATQAGVILGTAAYMSPEQAKGKAVDRRADIWAFGVVLYEMLTGKRLFEGPDMTETLAAVIMKDPDLDPVPPRVRRLIKRCLEKDPNKRLRDIGSVSLLLEDGAAIPEAPMPVTSSRPPLWALITIAALAVVAIGATVVALRARSASTDQVAGGTANLLMNVLPADALGPVPSYGRPARPAFAVSPDGATIVFGAFAGETRNGMLYRRALSETTATRFEGTDLGSDPFFSPDGRWVGFALAERAGVNAKLRKISLSGGPAIDICDVPSIPSGVSWGSNGLIVFARRGLWVVPEAGGAPEVLIPYDVNKSHYSPAFLPDGQTVLFTEIGSNNWDDAHIDAINIKTKERKTLLAKATHAQYSPTGHLVFMRNAALLAVPFDARSVSVTGAPVPLVAGVMQSMNANNSNIENGMGQYALSGNGTLVYASGGIYPTPTDTLVRVDKKGVETKLVEVKGSLVGTRLSPDGKRVVMRKTRDGSRQSDLWHYDLASATLTRLTSNGITYWSAWAPDSQSVLSATDNGLVSVSINGGNGGGNGGTTQAVKAPNADESNTPASISSDGKWFVYLKDTNDKRQIFVRPLTDGKPSGSERQFSPSSYVQRDAQLSPDDHWLAYVSNDSGSEVVYVQPFPGPGEKHRISSSGGTNPAWSRDGKQLFYTYRKTGSPRAFYAVDVSTSGEFRAGAPRLLFEGPYVSTTPLRSYDPTPDDQFIMVKSEDRDVEQRVTQLHVVVGWSEELKKRVPAK